MKSQSMKNLAISKADRGYGGIYSNGAYPANGALGFFDWRIYWYTAKRRKWFLIVPTILFGLGAFYYSLTLQPLYESSTTILVSGGKLLTREVRSVVPGVTAATDVTAAKNYVMSAQCISELIRTLELQPKPGLAERAANLSVRLPDMTTSEIAQMLFIEEVRENIEVETRGRDIIRISAAHAHPQKAYLLAKTLGDVFVDEFQKLQLGGVRGIREFSEEQLAIFDTKLEESEEKLRKFKQGVLREQVESDTSKTFESLRRLREDVVSMQVSMTDKKKRLDFLATRLSPELRNTTALETQDIPQLKVELYAKVSDLVGVLTNFNWRSPQILALNDEINRARERIREGVQASVQVAYADQNDASRALAVEHYLTKLDFEVLQFEKKALVDLISAIEKNLTRGPTHDMILDNLQREVDINRKLYLNFFQQSQGTQIEEQIQRRDAEFRLQTIELAQKPLYPVNKSLKTTLFLLCIPLLGLAVGGGVVYGLDYMDRSVNDVDAAEREFDIPVWGVIPEIDLEPRPTWQRTAWLSLLVLLVTVLAAAILYLVQRGDVLLMI